MRTARPLRWTGAAVAAACLLAGVAVLARTRAGDAVAATSGRPDWAPSRLRTAPQLLTPDPPGGWAHDEAARPGPPAPPRAPASPLLPESHPLLARRAGADPALLASSLAAPASPHAPEQVMLSFEGPGSVTVTWVTHPQV